MAINHQLLQYKVVGHRPKDAVCMIVNLRNIHKRQVQVRFEDGTLEIVQRRSLRQVKQPPEGGTNVR